MQKVFSREEIELNNEIVDILEWTTNEKGEYLYNGLPIIFNGRILIEMQHKMYFLEQGWNKVVFRPFKNLNHTYAISDFLYDNGIVDELIKTENEDGTIKCIAKKDGEIIREVEGDCEAEAKSLMLVLLESFNLDEDEIIEKLNKMKRFNQIGQEKMIERKERLKEEIKNKKSKSK